ncbi:MAG TPA: uracil-DNA glycosylase [Chloroflexota bacterium]|nr:uracil-DNA glycosylase [Chloroflexota bacterium]
MDQSVVTALERLKNEMEECTNCPLAESSQQLVFGEGNPSSPLVIVGEGPGEREAAEGRPFVGRAGQLLDKLMASAHLSREEVWITNVLKRRASRVVAGHVRNRLPKANELAYYREYLNDELRIISPKIILCLGNLAANALIHRNFRMTQEHGQWFSGPSGKKLMATYHPAYILRLEGAEYEQVMFQTKEDFAAAAAEFNALRSEDARSLAAG